MTTSWRIQCRTEDPEHEADLYLCEENVCGTKRVFECEVDIFAKSVVVAVVVGGVKEARSGRDHVRAIVQSKRGRSEQDQETEMWQSVCHELGRGTA